jgi:hypothetical protein
LRSYALKAGIRLEEVGRFGGHRDSGKDLIVLQSSCDATKSIEGVINQ